MAITIPEIVAAGAKDKEYTCLMNAINERLLKKIDEHIPILHPFFKCKLHFLVISQDNEEFIIYHDSDLSFQMVIIKLLQNKVKHVLHANHRRDLVLSNTGISKTSTGKHDK